MKTLQHYPIRLLKQLWSPTSTSKCCYSSQVNSAYPYTSELYKKNYIKYPVQSKSAICHDYVYHGDERLPSLKERLKEFKEPTDELIKNIGKSAFYPRLRELKEEINSQIRKNKNDKNLEKLARDLKLQVPIEQIENQKNLFKYFQDIVDIANHYNINKDMFNQAFFRPSLDLSVKYNEENVFHGNRLPARKAQEKPVVSWADVLEANKGEEVYHTLILVNLDGNFQKNDEEVLLWFVGNVKNNDPMTGEELKKYMQPLPMRGSGWHRCAYILYEHKAPISFDLPKENEGSVSFEQRNFSNKKFFAKYEEHLVPVGLSFFQTEWDLSVRSYFHNTLKMNEPVYEFDHGPKFVPRFEKFAHGQAFNWYLQEYNDRKDIQEHVMKDYLKEISPFAPYPTPAKYPILDLQVVKPRWFKYEMENKRQRAHEWNIAPYKYSHCLEKKKDQIKHLPYQ